MYSAASSSFVESSFFSELQPSQLGFTNGLFATFSLHQSAVHARLKYLLELGRLGELRRSKSKRDSTIKQQTTHKLQNMSRGFFRKPLDVMAVLCHEMGDMMHHCMNQVFRICGLDVDM